MAEPLSLEEFIQKSLSTLNTEDVPPQQVHEVFVGMQQYAPLRDILKDQKEITGDILLQVLTKEFPLAGKRAEALDQPMSPAEITARAEIFAKTQQQIPEAARQRFEQERKNYARKVARKWVERLRNDRLYNVSQEEEQIITRSIENLPPTTSATETRNAVVNQLQTLTQTNPNLSRGQTVLQQIAQTTDLAEPTQIRQQIFNTILDHPDADQPMLLGLAAQGVDFQRAAQLADLGKVFSADINPAIDVTRPTVFFQAFAKSGLQKLVAPAADAFLTVLPQETREAVIESVLTKSWERIDQKFGGAVVGSKPFQDALAQGNSAFAARPPSTGGIAAGFGRIIGDVVNPILGRNIDQVMIEQYLELSKTTTITQQLTWRHFYAMSAHSHDPSIFSFAFEGGKWILGFAGKRVVSGAAKGVAAKLSGTAIGAAIGSLIPIPGVGTAVGAIVGFIGGKLIEPLLRGAGSLLKNIFGGGLIARLMSGQGTGRWQDDFPLVATIIILLPIILIFLLPTFLNPQFIGHTAQSSALADLGGGNNEEGGSTYIKVTKTPSPDSFPDNNPGTVTYAITLQATAADLSNIRITDSFSVFGGSVNISAPPISGAPSSLNDGASFTTTISVSLAGLKDSLVTNTITVIADAKTINGETKTGEQRSATASVTIGKPPTGCFQFPDDPTPDPDMGGRRADPWDDKSAILSAVATLARSTSYMAQLCSGNRPIYLHRVRVNATATINGAVYGGAVTSANDIFLYNAGTKGLSALYTLSHESGHILARRTSLFTQFHKEGIANREGFIWTYPLGKSEWEDFAETMAVYVVHNIYTFRRGQLETRPGFGRFTFSPYPLHYDFAKRIFGIEY